MRNTNRGRVESGPGTLRDRFVANSAENYERYFVPAIGGQMAASLIDSAALRSGERVLDIACGTGTVTRLAAERVAPDGAASGLDLNPGMLAVARKVSPADLPIAWHEAPAEAIPLPDEEFDAVLCGMGLQFFAEKLSALREVRRVLKVGGRFVANLPGPTPPLFEIMAEEIGRHLGSDPAAFLRTVFSLHDADEIEGLARAAGFGQVRVRSVIATLRLPPPTEFLWQYIYSTPIAGALGGISEERREALETAFAARSLKFIDQGMVGDVKMTTMHAVK